MRRFVIILSAVLLVCYGIFNARNLILGPSIEIYNPISAETETAENTVVVKGKATNMSRLSISGRPISVDTENFFEEKLLLSPGFNIIEIKAKDRFGKETSKTIRIYYKQNMADAPSISISEVPEETL